MTQQQTDIDYDRIERAINFIAKHLHDQPSLEQITAAAHVSPYHFQQMFLKWSEVSPKKFAQFLSLSHAKTQLRQGVACWTLPMRLACRVAACCMIYF